MSETNLQSKELDMGEICPILGVIHRPHSGVPLVIIQAMIKFVIYTYVLALLCFTLPFSGL